MFWSGLDFFNECQIHSMIDCKLSKTAMSSNKHRTRLTLIVNKLDKYVAIFFHVTEVFVYIMSNISNIKVFETQVVFRATAFVQHNIPTRNFLIGKWRLRYYKWKLQYPTKRLFCGNFYFLWTENIFFKLDFFYKL